MRKSKFNLIYIFILVSVSLIDIRPIYSQPYPTIDTSFVHKIWDNEYHNAFTDLVVHGDFLYCVFRQASHHNPTADASVKILRSADGLQWDLVATIYSPDTLLPDIRDPHIIVNHESELQLVAGIASLDAASYKTYCWISTDGHSWNEVGQIGDNHFWLWDMFISNDDYYSIAFPAGSDRPINNLLRLYQSNDGTNFEAYLDTLVFDSTFRMTEASTIEMAQGDWVTLIRVDPFVSGPNSIGRSLLGRSEPPHLSWTWEELSWQIGSPNLLLLPDNNILLATRKHLAWNYFTTNLMWLDLESPNLIDMITLPSLGTNGNADNGYPGITIFNGNIWVSYYSSHADVNQLTNSDIYLAKVEIDLDLVSIHEKDPFFNMSLLQQNYPNPFNSRTIIPFHTEVELQISIIIYDLMGRHIFELTSNWFDKGSHYAEWSGLDADGHPVKSGIYFATLKSLYGIETKKITLLK